MRGIKEPVDESERRKEKVGLKLNTQKTEIMSSGLITWPKYWSFSFSINPSKEHSELISFRMDWLDLLAVQGVAKNWT